MTDEQKKEILREYWREYRRTHPEQIRIIERRYRENHREQLNEYQREYRKANPERVKAWRTNSKTKQSENVGGKE